MVAHWTIRSKAAGFSSIGHSSFPFPRFIGYCDLRNAWVPSRASFGRELQVVSSQTSRVTKRQPALLQSMPVAAGNSVDAASRVSTIDCDSCRTSCTRLTACDETGNQHATASLLRRTDEPMVLSYARRNDCPPCDSVGATGVLQLARFPQEDWRQQPRASVKETCSPPALRLFRGGFKYHAFAFAAWFPSHRIKEEG